MAASVSEPDLTGSPRRFARASVERLVPYEPGKPIEEVQRELGLDRCVKLASNEGQFGPLPAALEALARSAGALNRYPDGGSWSLRSALAERLGVRFEEVAVGAGADGLIDCLTQAALEPNDEIVCGWPSFPSYVIDALKLGATPVTVPLRQHRYDLDAMLDAIGPRTRIVYVCHPNNPTGTINSRSELEAFLDRVPDRVLVVVDQAYREYVEDPAYPDAIDEYFRAGRPVAVLRTFSKIYGLAGLRVGYLVASADVVAAVNKVKRAFDVSSAAQAAALASFGQEDEIARRRALTRDGLAVLERALREHGFDPVVPAAANFLYADTGADAQPLFEALLAQGVIVRPLHGFGAPTAIRVTCGAPDENEFFAAALARVGGGTGTR